MSGFGNLLVKIVATVCFIGYIPFAPGTWGSLAALLVVWYGGLATPQLVMVLAGVCIAGVLSAHAGRHVFGEEDSPRIVIDEFAGYMASVLFLPLSAGYMIAAFILFRALDIVKPPPIRQAERFFPGGWGVMIDDLIAGILTNVLLQSFRALTS